jgi:hypothetical protein
VYQDRATKRGEVAVTKQNDAHWRFSCPACGFGDTELGFLAGDDDLYCIVCLEETDRRVVLHRWIAVTEESAQPRLRGAFVAA